jgi:hypothetical protein
MFLFFAQKQSVKANSQNRTNRQDMRNRAGDTLMTILAIQIEAERPAGRRNETTSENDNDLNYDKPFRPAYRSFVFHKGANPLRKTCPRFKIISNAEKEPSLRQALRYEKTDKYDNDRNYNIFLPATFKYYINSK